MELPFGGTMASDDFESRLEGRPCDFVAQS